MRDFAFAEVFVLLYFGCGFDMTCICLLLGLFTYCVLLLCLVFCVCCFGSDLVVVWFVVWCCFCLFWFGLLVWICCGFGWAVWLVCFAVVVNLVAWLISWFISYLLCLFVCLFVCLFCCFGLFVDLLVLCLFCFCCFDC